MATTTRTPSSTLSATELSSAAYVSHHDLHNPPSLSYDSWPCVSQFRYGRTYLIRIPMIHLLLALGVAITSCSVPTEYRHALAVATGNDQRPRRQSARLASEHPCPSLLSRCISPAPLHSTEEPASPNVHRPGTNTLMKQLPPDDGVSSMRLPSGSQQQFPAKHVNPGCGCHTLEAPTKAIRDILKQGGTPLLSLGTTDHGRLNLLAKRYDGRTKYVIVQHTHLDGLASSRHGTITTCQLIRIAIRLGEIQAREVREDLCFWLDTLCEDKRRASPPSVFQDAHAALIIDPSVQALRSANDIDDMQAYLADVTAGHPRLALSKSLLIMSAYGYFDGGGG